MDLPARLFLYGTLMRGACNPVASALHDRLAPGVPGMAEGRLFAVPDPRGWYPALAPGRGTVRGMVHETRPGFDAALLARLDEWEDARAELTGEYRREALAVMTAGGPVEAQAYVYNATLPAGVLPVPGGDFAAFLAARGLAAFR